MTPCIHDLNETSCAICKKQDPVTLVLEGKTIAARFDAKCPGCGDRIHVGEDVHLTDHGWVCTSCSREAVSV